MKRTNLITDPKGVLSPPHPLDFGGAKQGRLVLKVNRKPRLEAMEMLCDTKLSPRLDKYDLTRFLNCHSTNLLLGAPGSGKTTLLIAFFDKLLRSCFNNIYLFQPSHSRASMKRDIFEEIPCDQKFDELNYENLSDVLDRIKNADKEEDDEESDCDCDCGSAHNRREEEEKPSSSNVRGTKRKKQQTHCIIFDDMGAYLKNKEIKKLLKEIIYNRRHYHVSVFFLCQSYLSCEKDIRKLFSNMFIFRVKGLQTIFDEVVESKRELTYELSRMVYDKEHQYMFINTDSQRIFKGFDEIICDDII
jgi:hypothetical protein